MKPIQLDGLPKLMKYYGLPLCWGNEIARILGNESDPNTIVGTTIDFANERGYFVSQYDVWAHVMTSQPSEFFPEQIQSDADAVKQAADAIIMRGEQA